MCNVMVSWGKIGYCNVYNHSLCFLERINYDYLFVVKSLITYNTCSISFTALDGNEKCK